MVEVTIREFREVVRFTIGHKLKHPILGLGAPGIGKSEVVWEVAGEFGYRVEDLRLAQMSEVEIGGLIYPDEKKEHTHWLKPDFFPEDDKTLLLLDELTSAPRRVQVAAYQLVLDRRIGRHLLPEGTVIVALGNREDDNGVYVEMAAPLANRFEIYDIQCNADVWLEDYARNYKEHGVNPLVSAFVWNFPGRLHTQTEDSMVFATPRSWKRVSDTLNVVNHVIDETVSLKIQASVGEVVGSEFIKFCKKYASFDLAERVLAGEVDVMPPEELGDLLYMIDIFENKILKTFKDSEDASTCAVLYKNVFDFSASLPSEVAAMCVSRISKISPKITELAVQLESEGVMGLYEKSIGETLDENVSGGQTVLL